MSLRPSDREQELAARLERVHQDLLTADRFRQALQATLDGSPAHVVRLEPESDARLLERVQSLLDARSGLRYELRVREDLLRSLALQLGRLAQLALSIPEP